MGKPAEMTAAGSHFSSRSAESGEVQPEHPDDKKVKDVARGKTDYI